MRRRLLLVLAAAVLMLALAVPCLAAAGPSFSMRLGSTFTITGRTGSAQGESGRAVGRVVLSGRWGTGAWRVFATTVTDDAGTYRLSIKPRRRGTLTLRIEPPDHRLRRYVLRVR